MHTDSEGAFRFSSVPAGAYTLRAEKGKDRATVAAFKVAAGVTEIMDVVLKPAGSSATTDKLPEFFDEPQFTVAGVTQTSNSGGHGSDVVLRNSEGLVRDTVSLGGTAKDTDSVIGSSVGSSGVSSSASSAEREELQKERAKLRAGLVDDSQSDDKARDGKPLDAAARLQQADVHHQIAQIEEKLGDPLEAVREYQRAAELAPNEQHLFDWGIELLAHRALEPASEVFAQGSKLDPRSVRMLIGLGVSWYARGSYDRAAEYLGQASDLAPADPIPYLFMGKMQSVEAVPAKEVLERLARFQRLAPDNALANYYYGAGLWKAKRAASTLDDASSAQVEALLQKAIRLDPKLGEARLQLGILYAERGDYARAVPEFEKAIELRPEIAETHYRLGLAYRRTGDEAGARKQLQLHEELSKRGKEDAERERSAIQEFVISLRDGKTE